MRPHLGWIQTRTPQWKGTPVTWIVYAKTEQGWNQQTGHLEYHSVHRSVINMIANRSAVPLVNATVSTFMTSQIMRNSSNTTVLDTAWDYLNSSTTSIAPEKMSFADLVRAETTYQVAKVIANNKFYVLLVIALVGNGLSLFAVRQRLRTSNPCFYIANIAVSDTMVIFLKWLYIMLSIYRPEKTNWECKILNFLSNVSVYSSIWLVIMMTAERCIAVVWPLKISGWVTMKRAKIAVAILYLIMAAINSVYLIILEGAPDLQTKRGKCIVHARYVSFYKSVWTVIDMVMYAYIPQILIFFFNILIIVKLAQARKGQAEMRNAPKSEQSQGQVTAMLLTVSITFFLLTSPYTFFYLCIQNDLWNFRASAKSYALYSLINTILRLLADLNHCVNFILYVTVGKRFREDIMKPCRRRRQNESNMSGSSTLATSLSSVAMTVTEERRTRNKDL